MLPAEEAWIIFERVGVVFETTSRGLGKFEALDSVSFEVKHGEFVAIVGPSGCGKSTLLNVISSLIHPTSGRVLIENQVWTRPHPKVGYMFQDDALLPWRTALQNVLLGLEIKGQSNKKERAYALLRKLGLEGFENHYPSELSGGMRKRVYLAMTLAPEPEILLMDEPFLALDAQTRFILEDDLLELWQTEKKTILFVTHDLSEAISLADRVIVMTARPGRIKSEFIIDLPRPRTTMEAKLYPHFQDIQRDVWKTLKEEVKIRGEETNEAFA